MDWNGSGGAPSNDPFLPGQGRDDVKKRRQKQKRNFSDSSRCEKCTPSGKQAPPPPPSMSLNFFWKASNDNSETNRGVIVAKDPSARHPPSFLFEVNQTIPLFLKESS
ncbi:hypothetical protein CDAR_181051 [Caerostris darwini]|uniref:Uncharacterized protein n=1 Tax=Caerostris darwini TaxID=1538125 RepID=A0AAV4U3V5_9ARAC|nr:hypothetical protein CDAR_181051 [Caerostris darwini]